MITLIISAFIFAFGIYLNRTDDYDILGAITTIFSGLFILIHVIYLLLSSYDHEIFMVKRESFQDTLNESRESGRELESAAILKEVSEWNKNLATRKYDNTTFFLGQYIDDRIMDVEPIK